jgi:two-component system sensor histidine kinase KdpD
LNDRIAPPDVSRSSAGPLITSEMLAYIAHELRTPLTAIAAHAHLGMRDPESMAQGLPAIIAETRRMQLLIDNMVLMGRSEASTVAEIEPVLLPPVLAATVALHQTRGARCPVRLDLPEGLPPVLADATYIEHILGNLLTNADKYSPEGAPVEVTAHQADPYVQICILDRGLGLGDEDPERLFEPFYRAPATAAHALGLGLGLSVTRRLAEAQGGRAWLRARDGGGTEAGFSLPIAKPLE